MSEAAPRRGDWQTSAKTASGGNSGNMSITGVGGLDSTLGGMSVSDPSAPVLLQPEAERLVEGLTPMSLREVGTEKWMKQHEVIEKLNLQAHQSARANSEDFVLEALITFEKLPVLIHELIVIETWKEFVYPKIEKDLAKQHSMRAYFVLYHEATLANLFEVLFYHDYAVEAVEDEMIELVDWTIRRLVYLNALPSDHANVWARLPKNPPKTTGDKAKDEAARMAVAKAAAAELNAKTPEQDLRNHYLEIQFRTCASAATVARYLTGHTEKLSLSVLARLLDTHDVLMLLCPLIESPPWTWRNSENGQWLKFQNQKWGTVPAADLLKLTKLEGQIWLSVYNILTDKACGERYYFSAQRKDNLLRARKYLNDVLLDQLPMLADIQRFMDEITIMKPPEASQSNMGSLIMEQVPAIRDSMVQRLNWVEEARFALQDIFGKTNDKDDQGLAALAELYAGDALESLVAEQEITAEELRGPLVNGKIKIFEQGKDDTPVVMMDCKVAEGKPTPQSTSNGMFERYKIVPIGSAFGHLVPFGGSVKVILTFQDSTTTCIESEEVLLDLPTMIINNFDECPEDEPIEVDEKTIPAAKWVKVGSFDEKAITQIQMKRTKMSRKEFATVLPDGSARLHCYSIGSMFVSVPMVGRAAKDAMERKLKQEMERMEQENGASEVPQTEDIAAGKGKENETAPVAPSTKGRKLITEVNELD
jgi:zinc finger MYND domain-containing protein 10